jgi:(R)-amidase
MQVEIAQLGGRDGDKAANLASALAAIERCAPSTALLVLPELHLTGFPTARNVAALAEPLDGPSLQRVQAAASRKGVAVAVGLVEAAAGGPYNTTVLLDPREGLRLHYRKTHLFGGERGVVQPGDRFATTLWNGLRVGLLVCYDIEFPETARALAQLGAQLLVVTNGNMDPYGPVHRACIVARAIENQVFAVMANRVGPGDDYVFAGGSAVVDPFGAILCEAGREEATLCTRLDPARLALARRDYDYLRERRVPLAGAATEEGSLRTLRIGS